MRSSSTIVLAWRTALACLWLAGAAGLRSAAAGGEAALPAPPPPPSPAAPSAAPEAPSGPLEAPLYLTATAGNRSVLLSWYPSEGRAPVSAYLVYRGLAPDSIGSAPINLTPLAETSFSDNALSSVSEPENRRTYYYRVRAVAPDGRLSPYSNTVAATPGGPLLPPSKLEAQAGDGRVSLRWQRPLSTGEGELARILLLRAEQSGKLQPYRSLDPGESVFTDSGLSNGRPVFYALVSEDTQGRRSPPSPELRALPFRPLAAPRRLSAKGLGEDLVRLKWEPPAGSGSFRLRGYNVYRSTSASVDISGLPLNKVLVTGALRYDDGPEQSLEAPRRGMEYTYVVVAVDELGQASEPSNPSAAGPVAALTKLETGEFAITPGNTLQIQGRKTINMAYTWYVKRDPGNLSSNTPSTFNLDQQLQVRLTGKVGSKIRVDVDYNDKAQVNQQQKISVVYTGEQQEVFKEFAFGDIQMDLSSSRTQFAGYNKSLFGAKLKLVSPDERLRLTAIGAQTKGFTETKHFVGGYELVRTGNDPGRNYPDTGFVLYRYYYLSRDKALVEGDDYIEPGSVIIYMDQPGLTNNSPNRITVSNANTTFNFVPLNPNIDYLVDSASGLVTFNIPIGPTYNLAVAYRVHHMPSGVIESVGYGPSGGFDFSGGFDSDWAGGRTSDSQKLIQYGSLYGSQRYDSHMSMQYYSLGEQNILNPKLDPDFKLIVYGANQSTLYQLDPRSDYTNVVDFDTRLGLIRFRVPFPFAKTTTQPSDLAMDAGFTKVESVYNPNNLDAYSAVQRTNNFTIHVEYKHRLTSYNLRFNIVRGSEVIVVDGKRLARDIDYFLDYDTGILVFSNPDLVKENSSVDATYEYLPFGGQFTSTIWGARGEYDLTKDLSLGTTFLSNAADAPQETPDLRSGVYSLQVLDGDVQARVPQALLDKFTGSLPLLGGRTEMLGIKASAEAAHSWFKPNTYSRNNENGTAMVDNFESVDNIVATSTDRRNWLPSSIPLRYTGDLGPVPGDRRFTRFSTQLRQAHDSAQRITAGEDPNLSMIELNWRGFDTAQRWDSWIYSFGPSPNTAISQSDHLNLWVNASQPLTLHIDVGPSINEDSIASAYLGNVVLATESTTGILAQGQDIGILNSLNKVFSPYPLPPPIGSPDVNYSDPGYWGAGNQVLDTEDMNADGRVDLSNNYYTYSVALDPAKQSASLNNGFQELNLDLTRFGVVGDSNIMSTVPGTSTFYSNVRRVRFWIDGAGGSSGTLTIESIRFTGNKWQVRADPNVLNMVPLSVTVDTEKFQVRAVNGSTDPAANLGLYYTANTNFYTPDSTRSVGREQALQIAYSLTSGEQSAGRPYYQARRLLNNGLFSDFGNYQKLRVDLYKPVATLPGERFLIRLGADDLNYFEYSIPIDSLPVAGWQTVTLALDGSDGARTQLGQPYLRQINYVALAVHTLNPTPNYGGGLGPNYSEVLWVNNLRATDAIMREGGAARLSASYELLKGAVVVNHELRDVESDFIRIDEQGNAPARHQRSQVVDARISALPWLPMGLRYEESQYFVDAAHQGDPLYSRNFIDPDQSDRRTTANFSLRPTANFVLNASGSVQSSRQVFQPQYIATQQLLQQEAINPNLNSRNARAGTDASLRIPSGVWLLGGDQLRAEYSFDASEVDYDRATQKPLNLSYRDSGRQSRSFRGSYSGSYKLGSWLTINPSYSMASTEARGNVPAPSLVSGGNPYYQVDGTGRVAGGFDYVPQSRSFNPSLQLQLADLGPLARTRFSYNFSQTRDFVRNELRTPGSMDFGSSLQLRQLSRFLKFVPDLEFSQGFQVDSVVNNDPRVRSLVRAEQLRGWFGSSANPGFAGRYDYAANLQSVPSIALLEQASPLQREWWIRLDGLGLRENLRDPLNIENIATSASRRSNTSLNTRFELPLLPGFSPAFSPRLVLTQARIMAAPEQVTENRQLTLGSGLDLREPRIPFYRRLSPQNLNISYDFTKADNYVARIDESIPTSQRQSHALRSSLPMQPLPSTTLTLGLNYSLISDTNFLVTNNSVARGGESEVSALEPSLRLVYLFNQERPWKLPDIWPFDGREFRIKQALRLDNELRASLRSTHQTATQAALTDSVNNLYTLVDQVSYNVLDNVKLNFLVEQNLLDVPRASSAINQAGGYYSIKLALGLEAVF